MSGEIELYQSSNSDTVEIRGSVLGLTPGLHGFHMHRDGNTSDDCKAAGPHFNPHNVSLIPVNIIQKDFTATFIYQKRTRRPRLPWMTWRKM